MSARRLAAFGILALVVLPLVWHLWWLPPQQVPAWLAALLHTLPMLPAAVLVLLRRRSAPFWGSLGALLMFSHGVMEAWVSVPARVPALLEVALALLVIVAASWNGFWHRFGRKPGV
ncbi:DUF2069 domain-containing protein [Denitratimonas sp. CY0512]|uniref:DUF2069 domain-containing protein n=1 Tax=Denitratimonas sp. CY0512 TaxID=3131940 RepID=UPI0030ADEE5F